MACYCLQQAVWLNGGYGSLENATKQQIIWLVASAGSPPLRQAAGRCTQGGNVPADTTENKVETCAQLKRNEIMQYK